MVRVQGVAGIPPFYFLSWKSWGMLGGDLGWKLLVNLVGVWDDSGRADLIEFRQATEFPPPCFATPVGVAWRASKRGLRETWDGSW